MGLNGNVGALVSFTGDRGGICIWPGGGLKFKSKFLYIDDAKCCLYLSFMHDCDALFASGVLDIARMLI